MSRNAYRRIFTSKKGGGLMHEARALGAAVHAKGQETPKQIACIIRLQ